MKPGSLLAVIALVVVLLAGMGIYSDINKLRSTVQAFSWWVMLPALGLAFSNYLIRFGKWQVFLLGLGERVPLRENLSVYLSGLSMSVTPGKVGEVLKCYLLHRTSGVAVTQTFPVVVAERLTDLLAVVLLAAYGVSTLGIGWDALIAALALCGFVVLMSVWTRGFTFFLDRLSFLGFIRRRRQTLLDLQSSLLRVVSWRSLTVGTFISLFAWLAECLAFYLILGAAGVAIPLGDAIFAYSLGTVAGAVTMLPGGLVATEASMVALLEKVLHCCSSSQAITTVLVVRICTLWFAVLVGMIALRHVKTLMGSQSTRQLVNEATSSSQ